MQRSYDLEEIIYLAQRGMSASFIKEELGLSISERQIQRLVSSRLGRRPTRQSVQKKDILRERVVAYMESRGHNSRQCFNCGRATILGTAIRAVNDDLSLDALVFVCLRCAAPGDV